MKYFIRHPAIIVMRNNHLDVVVRTGKLDIHIVIARRQDQEKQHGLKKDSFHNDFHFILSDQYSFDNLLILIGFHANEIHTVRKCAGIPFNDMASGHKFPTDQST